ncbi:cytochrome P450 [Amycolatopsis magusensis]|uniref:cytochrome P450 n=1 Tax=Amycolatopsis magusensis TaxID=882444 RepID=UPI003C2CC7BC
MTSPAAGPPPGCPAHTERARLYDEEFARDPAGVYARMRAAHGQIAPVELAPGVNASLVLGYEAALEVLRAPSTFPRDPRRWQQNQPEDSPVLPMMGYRPNCLFTDGAVHARLRSAVTGSLSRLNPHALRDHIERTARALIARFSADGEADLLNDYATTLSLQVFNHLFGCPPALGDRLVAGMRGIFDMVDPERANAELTASMLELLALKRAQPGQDVPSWMMAHPARLTDEELLHQLVLLMGAGTEPQQNLIANGIRLLLIDDRFAGDLAGGSLHVEDALEEILWGDPPMANYSAGYPWPAVDLLGTHLPAAEPVVISFAAANTDPALRAEQRVGNRAHIAWGAGVHSCPAQGPARLIATTAIETLLDALPDLRLAVPDDQLRWRPGPFHRALAALPVQFTPVRNTVPAPVPSTEPTGEHRWNPHPAPSSSTPPAATSTPRTPNSAPAAPRRWWNSLARWWRGQ